MLPSNNRNAVFNVFMNYGSWERTADEVQVIKGFPIVKSISFKNLLAEIHICPPDAQCNVMTCKGSISTLK